MADLTPQAFAEKWAKSKLSERSSYQQHFLYLCGMLGQPTPADVDPEGDFYTSETGPSAMNERSPRSVTALGGMALVMRENLDTGHSTGSGGTSLGNHRPVADRLTFGGKW